MIGSSRTLVPVAWKTALTTAGAVPLIASSPKPLTPSGLAWRSGSPTNTMPGAGPLGTSAWTGKQPRRRDAHYPLDATNLGHPTMSRLS